MAGDDTPPRPSKVTSPAPAKMAYRVEEAVAATGLSRSVLYEDIKAGALTTRKRGTATIILAEDLAAYLDALPGPTK